MYASADRTTANSVVLRWEEKSNWDELSRTPREEGGQLWELQEGSQSGKAAGRMGVGRAGI